LRERCGRRVGVTVVSRWARARLPCTERGDFSVPLNIDQITPCAVLVVRVLFCRAFGARFIDEPLVAITTLNIPFGDPFSAYTRLVSGDYGPSPEH